MPLLIGHVVYGLHFVWISWDGEYVSIRDDLHQRWLACWAWGLHLQDTFQCFLLGLAIHDDIITYVQGTGHWWTGWPKFSRVRPLCVTKVVLSSSSLQVKFWKYHSGCEQDHGLGCLEWLCLLFGILMSTHTRTLPFFMTRGVVGPSTFSIIPWLSTDVKWDAPDWLNDRSESNVCSLPIPLKTVGIVGLLLVDWWGRGLELCCSLGVNHDCLAA